MSDTKLPILSVVRHENGEWPHRRITIGYGDPYQTGLFTAVMVSPRFADLDESEAEANEMVRRCNSYSELYEALEGLLNDALDPLDKDSTNWWREKARQALAKARGES